MQYIMLLYLYNSFFFYLILQSIQYNVDVYVHQNTAASCTSYL